MAAITPTEVSTADGPLNLTYGTGKKRKLIFVRATSTGTGNTLDLATYVSNLSDIEGIFFNTVDNVLSATAPTWSTTTLTMAQHAGSGVLELGVLVNLT